MNVLVTGGTGYVGQPIVRSLTAAGHQVHVVQRPNSQRSLHTAAKVSQVDLFDHAGLAAVLQDVDAVVHLVGIIREEPRQGQTMRRIHVEATRRLLAAAKQAGVERFIHMSALGARADATSGYHRSKYEAEQLVRESGIPYTIFQPSVVFGEGGPGSNFVSLLRQLVEGSVLVPMIGDGAFQLQPVATATVAEAFTKALTAQCAVDQTYQLGGPDVILYRDLLSRLAAVSGRRLRTFSVPVPLMKAVVPVLQRIPTFPLTADQLTMLLEGNVCKDTDSVYQDLDLTVVPFQLST